MPQPRTAMTECVQCRGKAQLWLCQPCISDLRDMLIGLARGQRIHNGEYAPGWLESLSDAAQGRTRFGSSERRTPRYRRPLIGESSLASQIELLPGERWEIAEGPAREGESWPLKVPLDIEIDLEKARRDRMNSALRHALGAARINLRASELMDYTRSVLVEWIRDICETRGVQTPEISRTEELALWLARHVTALASDEAADVCYREIKEIVREIERTVDRPASHRYFGACPTVTENQELCNTGLYAKRDQTEIRCWKCKATYNTHDLIDDRLDAIDELLYSAQDIMITMEIPERTWRWWRAEKKLIIRGEREGHAAYWVSDIRELLDQKTQKATTGAAARRRVG
jgi:hypothetical protein